MDHAKFQTKHALFLVLSGRGVPWGDLSAPGRTPDANIWHSCTAPIRPAHTRIEVQMPPAAITGMQFFIPLPQVPRAPICGIAAPRLLAQPTRGPKCKCHPRPLRECSFSSHCRHSRRPRCYMGGQPARGALRASSHTPIARLAPARPASWPAGPALPTCSAGILTTFISPSSLSVFRVASFCCPGCHTDTYRSTGYCLLALPQ